MNYIKYTLSTLLLFSLVSCSSDSSNDETFLNMYKEADDATLFSTVKAKQRQRTKYLAYEHRITVELPKTEIEQAFEKIISFCVNDTESKCTILHSSLDTGNYSSGNIQVRILPSGVEKVVNLASKQGHISNRSTDAEDLQDVIVNSNKRLEMLSQYQAQLIELEKNTDNDIESLIKIAKELSKVQSDIEYAEGKKAKLLQRTQMDIAHISLLSLSYTSFWGPVSNSLMFFGENLSEGISQAIIAVAYLLPWVVIILFFLYILRIVWRKSRGRSQ